jgi:hypothetical protein
MEYIEDDYEYQNEVAKSIYIMCGVGIVFLLGLFIERNKQKPPILPMHVENKATN